MKPIIAWFAENRVAANLLMLLLLVGGATAIFRVAVRTFPDMELDAVTVNVQYRGAAPEEVEQGVCSRVEEAVDGLSDIDRMSSSASEGSCRVMIELVQGADVDRALDEIKTRVDSLTTLPDETEKPVVSQVTAKRGVIDLALVGEVDERVLKELGEQLRDEIAALPHITAVELRSTRRYEVSIEVPEVALRRYGLRFDDVVRAVRRSSLDLPGGSIKTSGGEILLRSKGQAYRGRDFEQIVLITRPDGTRVEVGDVAEVVDGFEDAETASRFDAKPSAILRVYRVGEQDTLAIAEEVKGFAAARAATLPPGLELIVWQDSSEILSGRLEILLRNGRTGFVLVFILLALFLRLRLAIWVALGVPIAFAGALWLFPPIGISIDMISLFAFILVLGILVDDAVVVGESVHTHQQRLGDRLRGAISGTQAVTVPVVFGVLTSIVTFTPMLLVSGGMAIVFQGIASVVVLCLVFSLIESQLILPAHLSHGKSGDESGPALWRRLQHLFSDGLERFVEQRYRPALARVLEWRYTTVAAGAAALILTLGVLAGNRLPFSFFPAIEADYISADLSMPAGMPAERTLLGVQQIEAALEGLRAELDAELDLPGGSVIQHVFTSIGEQPFASGGGPGPPNPFGGVSASHLAEVVVELIPAEQRDISTVEVARRWRERVGDVPDAVELTFASNLFTPGSDVDVQLQGPDVERLRAAAENLKRELATYPGVAEISDSFRLGKEEVKLAVRPSAETLGITLQDLASQVRQAFYGEEAQRVQRGRDDVRVMVRYPERERRSLGDLEELRIRTVDGGSVPFGSVARAEMGRGYSTIQRADRQRVVNVTADVEDEITTSNQVLARLAAGPLASLPSEYPGVSYSLQGVQREQTRAFGSLLSWYLVALFGVYGLLAVPLRSYAQPFIVMSVIPFGLCGAILGHLIMRLPNTSFLSALGLVALSGVVVNASLVLVYEVNENRARGAGLVQAVTDAAALRFRPIFLTSITTFAGLLPLMLEQSMQAQFLIPMAVSLAWGVVFSTAVTLLIVPSLYLILEDLKAARQRLLGRPAAANEPSGLANRGSRAA